MWAGAFIAEADRSKIPVPDIDSISSHISVVKPTMWWTMPGLKSDSLLYVTGNNHIYHKNKKRNGKIYLICYFGRVVPSNMPEEVRASRPGPEDISAVEVRVFVGFDAFQHYSKIFKNVQGTRKF